MADLLTQQTLIVTQRLVIRPWSVEDVPHYQAMSRDIGYTCFSPPGIFLAQDEKEVTQRIMTRIKLFNEHKIGKFLIFEKLTNSFVGTCGGDFFELNCEKQVELGYRIMLAHWGKGYATEAGAASIQYLMNDVKFGSVHAFALPQNQQSLNVLRKLRMKFERDFVWFGLPHRLYRIDQI